jgi:hypothetical protein
MVILIGQMRFQKWYEMDRQNFIRILSMLNRLRIFLVKNNLNKIPYSTLDESVIPYWIVFSTIRANSGSWTHLIFWLSVFCFELNHLIFGFLRNDQKLCEINDRSFVDGFFVLSTGFWAYSIERINWEMHRGFTTIHKTITFHDFELILSIVVENLLFLIINSWEILFGISYSISKKGGYSCDWISKS